MLGPRSGCRDLTGPWAYAVGCACRFGFACREGTRQGFSWECDEGYGVLRVCANPSYPSSVRVERVRSKGWCLGFGERHCGPQHRTQSQSARHQRNVPPTPATVPPPNDAKPNHHGHAAALNASPWTADVRAVTIRAVAPGRISRGRGIEIRGAPRLTGLGAVASDALLQQMARRRNQMHTRNPIATR